MGNRPQTLDEIARDRLADLRQFDAGERHLGPGGGRQSRGGGSSFRGLDIPLDDPAAGTRAAHRIELYAALRRHATCQRRRLDLAAVLLGRLLGRRG